MPVGHGRLGWGERVDLGRRLRSENYQQAIVLPNSLKSALVPMFADIPQRTGWRGEMRYVLINDIRLLVKRYYPFMVQRFVALAYPGDLPFDGEELKLENIPRPALMVDEKQAMSLFDQYGVQQDKPMLALCPGAEFGAAKRWPEEHFASVASEYIGRGWQVVLFGSGNDKEVAELIRNKLSLDKQGSCINLAGSTSLAEAIDLLSKANAVVSNDSGLMHICAALNRPMAVVYGSTSPSFTPPLCENVSIEYEEVDCGPCFKRECPLGEKEGPLKCLTGLTADKVIHSLDKLI